MVEQVKVLMDEQAKLALHQLEGALSELLAPLKKLDAGGGSVDDDMAVRQVLGEIRKLSGLMEDVEDAVVDLKRKIVDVCDNQGELFRKMTELSETIASRKKNRDRSAVKKLARTKAVVKRAKKIRKG